MDARPFISALGVSGLTVLLLLGSQAVGAEPAQDSTQDSTNHSNDVKPIVAQIDDQFDQLHCTSQIYFKVT